MSTLFNVPTVKSKFNIINLYVNSHDNLMIKLYKH